MRDGWIKHRVDDCVKIFKLLQEINGGEIGPFESLEITTFLNIETTQQFPLS